MEEEAKVRLIEPHQDFYEYLFSLEILAGYKTGAAGGHYRYLVGICWLRLVHTQMEAELREQRNWRARVPAITGERHSSPVLDVVLLSLPLEIPSIIKLVYVESPNTKKIVRQRISRCTRNHGVTKTKRILRARVESAESNKNLQLPKMHMIVYKSLQGFLCHVEI